MYFKPLQIFGMLALLLASLAVGIGVSVKLVTGMLPDVTVSSLFSTALIFLGLGLLGDLINGDDLSRLLAT